MMATAGLASATSDSLSHAWGQFLDRIKHEESQLAAERIRAQTLASEASTHVLQLRTIVAELSTLKQNWEREFVQCYGELQHLKEEFERERKAWAEELRWLRPQRDPWLRPERDPWLQSKQTKITRSLDDTALLKPQTYSQREVAIACVGDIAETAEQDSVKPEKKCSAPVALPDSVPYKPPPALSSIPINAGPPFKDPPIPTKGPPSMLSSPGSSNDELLQGPALPAKKAPPSILSSCPPAKKPPPQIPGTQLPIPNTSTQVDTNKQLRYLYL